MHIFPLHSFTIKFEIWFPFSPWKMVALRFYVAKRREVSNLWDDWMVYWRDHMTQLSALYVPKICSCYAHFWLIIFWHVKIQLVFMKIHSTGMWPAPLQCDWLMRMIMHGFLRFFLSPQWLGAVAWPTTRQLFDFQHPCPQAPMFEPMPNPKYVFQSFPGKKNQSPTVNNWLTTSQFWCAMMCTSLKRSRPR